MAGQHAAKSLADAGSCDNSAENGQAHRGWSDSPVPKNLDTGYRQGILRYECQLGPGSYFNTRVDHQRGLLLEIVASPEVVRQRPCLLP